MLLNQLLAERDQNGVFRSIEFKGESWISVQANETAHCNPKSDFEGSEGYYEFEVMVSGLRVPEWEIFWKEPGLYGNVPKSMIENLIIKMPMRYYHDQEIVNEHAKRPYEAYCEECDFEIDGVKSFAELRALIVSMEGAYVYDGEGGNISICPICKKDSLVINPA